MKKIAILAADAVVFLIILAWAAKAPWARLLGFSYYHSRGDVWLPTPPAATGYFHAIVMTGSLSFAIVFLLASALLFILARSRPASTGSQPVAFFYDSFYGDAPKLTVKYFAVLIISFFAPFIFHYMRRFHRSRTFTISGGVAVSIVIFIFVLAIAHLIARRRPGRAA